MQIWKGLKVCPSFFRLCIVLDWTTDTKNGDVSKIASGFGRARKTGSRFCVPIRGASK